ncbi:hypothetical protein D3C76_1152930 [compost metagenome]
MQGMRRTPLQKIHDAVVAIRQNPVMAEVERVIIGNNAVVSGGNVTTGRVELRGLRRLGHIPCPVILSFPARCGSLTQEVVIIRFYRHPARGNIANVACRIPINHVLRRHAKLGGGLQKLRPVL